MSDKKCPGLKAGDLIDVVAPGIKAKSETLKKVKNFVRSWDLQVRFGENLMGSDLLCANTREFRFKDLGKALLAKDSKMIWCLRGGYGSLHLLKALKAMKKPKNCKLFMGLSDITSLHIFLVQHWGWSTIHGCNMDRLATGEATKAELSRFKEVLFGITESLDYPLKPLNREALKARKIQASLIGGNLTTLQSSLGTDFQVNGEQSFLFFEDIGERAYRIDRILEHINQLGLFKKTKAIVFGPFTGCREPGGQNLIPRLLKQFAGSMKCPVFSGLRSGHGPNQCPLPLGTEAIISGGPQARITMKTGVVSHEKAGVVSHVKTGCKDGFINHD